MWENLGNFYAGCVNLPVCCCSLQRRMSGQRLYHSRMIYSRLPTFDDVHTRHPESISKKSLIKINVGCFSTSMYARTCALCVCVCVCVILVASYLVSSFLCLRFTRCCILDIWFSFPRVFHRAFPMKSTRTRDTKFGLSANLLSSACFVTRRRESCAISFAWTPASNDNRVSARHMFFLSRCCYWLERVFFFSEPRNNREFLKCCTTICAKGGYDWRAGFAIYLKL